MKTSLLAATAAVMLGLAACGPADVGQSARPQQLEGTVADVDAAAGIMRVTRGPLGLFTTTFEVGSATRIRVVGRPATLADIRETATVRVGYTTARGRTIATSVDMVLPPTVASRAGS